jgi:hypothetical protein
LKNAPPPDPRTTGPRNHSKQAGQPRLKGQPAQSATLFVQAASPIQPAPLVLRVSPAAKATSRPIAHLSAHLSALRHAPPGKRAIVLPCLQHALPQAQAAKLARPLAATTARSHLKTRLTVQSLLRPSPSKQGQPDEASKGSHPQAVLLQPNPRPDPEPDLTATVPRQPRHLQPNLTSPSRPGINQVPKIARPSSNPPHRVPNLDSATKTPARCVRPTSASRRSAHRNAPAQSAPAHPVPAVRVRQHPTPGPVAHRQTVPDQIVPDLTVQAKPVPVKAAPAKALQVPAAPTSHAHSAAQAANRGHSPPAAESHAPAALVPAANPEAPAIRANPPDSNTPANPAERIADRD